MHPATPARQLAAAVARHAPAGAAAGVNAVRPNPRPHASIGGFAGLALLLVSTCGCVIAADRVNTNCAWTNDAARPLDPGRAADQRHLLDDVTVAEELAIRHADAARGFRSGRYAGQDEYVRTRERCLATLVDAIAATHRVDAVDVRAQLNRRSLATDIAAVFLPAVLLFCLTADFTIARIHRRFARDETAPRLIATAIASIVVTGAGYLAGNIWSMLFEEKIRLRANHLSYRAFYLPWSRHPVAVLSVGVALFWVMVLARTRWPARAAGARRYGTIGFCLGGFIAR